jgi:hypothetical protein
MTKTIQPVPEDNKSHKGPGSDPKIPSTPPRATATTKNTISANRGITATWCRTRAIEGAGEGASFSSWPGLTRPSILKKHFAKMDGCAGQARA